MNGHSVLRATPTESLQSIRLAERAAAPPRVDLLAAAEHAHALGTRFFLWQSPDRRRTLLGAGELVRIVADGPQRFATIGDAWRAIDLAAAPRALLLGGFAFADTAPGGPYGDLHAGDLFVPRVLLTEDDGLREAHLFARSDGAGADFSAALALLGALQEGSPAPPAQLRLLDPPGARRSWRRRIVSATGAIAQGSLEKVVLARRRLVLYQRPPGLAGVLHALSSREADCRIFAFGDGARVFLGATPELLCRCEDGVAHVDCLAGSAPRDADPRRDRAIGEALLASVKNRREHAHVVSAVRRALEGLGLAPSAPAQPRLRRLAHLQHLSTPVRAACGEDLGVLRVAGALHPTPAVGGAPQHAALAWLGEHEGLARGFFAGAVGFAAAQGGGEFDVALRSALLLRRSARIYAGCGIVEGSDPDDEFQETELKMLPIETALRGAR